MPLAKGLVEPPPHFAHIYFRRTPAPKQAWAGHSAPPFERSSHDMALPALGPFARATAREGGGEDEGAGQPHVAAAWQLLHAPFEADAATGRYRGDP